jgi:NADH-quinone oxidoreductase subunit J
MNLSFAIIGLLTIASAIAAMTLRNLVHCALALTITFAGLAAFYLQLDAQFVGFAQVLVYVGAVAILIVFAILLTRGSEPPKQGVFSSSSVLGATIAIAVFAALTGMILSSKGLTHELTSAPSATVGQIGDQLMTRYILPLEVVGLLLTAAMIGAVIIAMREEAK